MFRKIAMLAVAGSMVLAIAMPTGAAPKNVYEGKLYAAGEDIGRVRVTERSDGTYSADVLADGLAPGLYTFYFGDSTFNVNEACTFTPNKRGRGQCHGRVTTTLQGHPYVAAIATGFPYVVQPEALAWLS